MRTDISVVKDSHSKARQSLRNCGTRSEVCYIWQGAQATNTGCKPGPACFSEKEKKKKKRSQLAFCQCQQRTCSRCFSPCKCLLYFSPMRPMYMPVVFQPHAADHLFDNVQHLLCLAEQQHLVTTLRSSMPDSLKKRTIQE